MDRRRVPRECLHDLLRQPLRRRMPGHRKPEELASTMTHDENRKQALECQGRNHAEIDRRNRVYVVAEQCPPSLGWRPSVPDHVYGDRPLADLEPEVEPFAMDAWTAPQWVLLAHPSDEPAQRSASSGPAWPTARFPARVRPKPRSMPSQDRVRLNDARQIEQPWPEPSHPYQQCSVTPTKPQMVRYTPQGNIELMPEKEVFDFKLTPRPEQVGDEGRDEWEDRKHRAG